ncbi:major facilitator superfamily domain-containing protein [Microdochium bolleyi]|uniref:Major facilitator superfamily domain-containing protein n=1 Tax=Microdochium bolleyi TaxID=196109 RepID=A0A136IKJ9_9PEZI|nr:major facilitator superfamily domain-containing protein [Microdochium bolleyi]
MLVVNEKTADSHSKIQDDATKDLEEGSQGTHKQDEQSEQQQPPGPPYSVFTDLQKRCIVFIVALTTLLPPLTASIFYPVITLLSRELNVSITEINLTITIYLIIQGIAPSFVGNLSDVKGRRPALLAALIVYICGCVGAALGSSYGVLFGMRCLQSAGGSGTIALSLATVSDIVTSAERGKYSSYVQMGWMLGPSLGPSDKIIGGLISRFLGWQAIFWFLAIYAGVVWLVAAMLLPETSRQIVGNGSIQPTAWNKTGASYLRQLSDHRRSGVVPPAPATEKPERPTTITTTTTPSSATAALNPLASLRVFRDPETSLLLVYSGLVYASSYMVLSTLPGQLERVHGLDTLRVSLCFLAPGFGTVTSVLLTGRVLDWNFRRHAARTPGVGAIPRGTGQQEYLNRASFPLERARLQSSAAALLLAGASLLCYGWTLQQQQPGTVVPLAVPLVFLFLQAAGSASAFSGLSNLIMDLNRDRPGAASAAMNITRCWLGAGGTALASPLVSATGGVGWLGVVISGFWLLFSPCVVLVFRNGPRWREEKRGKSVA